ncbi:MAG: hypothetical protein ABIH83_05590 [Candidatus Micrarchaeota archaeon]
MSGILSNFKSQTPKEHLKQGIIIPGLTIKLHKKAEGTELVDLTENTIPLKRFISKRLSTKSLLDRTDGLYFLMRNIYMILASNTNLLQDSYQNLIIRYYPYEQPKGSEGNDPVVDLRINISNERYAGVELYTNAIAVYQGNKYNSWFILPEYTTPDTCEADVKEALIPILADLASKKAVAIKFDGPIPAEYVGELLLPESIGEVVKA